MKFPFSGDNLPCFHLQFKKNWCEKFQKELRNKIYSKIRISLYISKTYIRKDYSVDMSRVPLMTAESNLQVADRRNMVMIEVYFI